MGKDIQGPRERAAQKMAERILQSPGGCDGQQNLAGPAEPRSQCREEPTDPLSGLVTTELKP